MKLILTLLVAAFSVGNAVVLKASLGLDIYMPLHSVIDAIDRRQYYPPVNFFSCGV